MPEPANATPACVLGTDFTKDTSSVPNYTILKFTKTGSCSFRNTEKITILDYLIVGGGGGGGAHVGGGGGGGGVLQGTNYSVAGLGAFPITVGGGGTGAWVTTSWQTYGSNGGNSIINGVTAFGGGVGGIWNSYAPGYANGVVGSAGGSGYSGNYGGGTPGQGTAGGTGFDVQPHAAGGGGGAGQVGGNGSQTTNGNGTGGKGGNGVSVDITGTPTYYGGGGGGGVHGDNNNSTYTGGAGGLGGGGAGSSHSGNYDVTPRQPANYGTSGTANTGGGGGGSGGGLTFTENKAGNGGSGIVIIKYLTSSTKTNDVDSALNLSSTYHYAYTNIAGADAIQPSSSEAFTVEAWARPAYACTTRCTIFSREGQMRLGIYNGKIEFILYNTNGWNSWTDLTLGDIPVNKWSHIALTRNGTTIKVFLNGYQIASYSQTYAPLPNNVWYLTYVGTIHGATEPFVGAIDEVKVWKTDRSASIATDMNSNDATSTGLVAYWNFNEGSGSVAYNIVPAVNSDSDLTVSNTGIWNSSFISESTVNGLYTTVTFYRTYLTGNGGWKAPSINNNVLALVVGGGGGGGGGYQGGGGGAGGFIETLTTLTTGNYYPIQVGTGGRGTSNPTQATNGIDSSAFGFTAIGGGNGASEFNVSNVNTQYNSSSGGSGGGGSWGSVANRAGSAGTAGQGSSGGNGDQHVTMYFDGGGGGGAGSPGSDGSSTKGGNGGAGKLSIVTGTYLAGGGGGSLRSATVVANAGSGGTGGGGNSGYVSNASVGATGGSANGTANTGGGGGAGMSSDGTGGSGAGFGGSGIVAFRYLTASKPSYTYPVNAYLNVGMTETFTTNVAVDSATAALTRTFKWESSTAGVAGPWATIKQGTGASNAFFSWIPSDTSTSGPSYLYRLTVTDSDTAGLFSTDSSTAYAIINKTLLMSGATTIKKTINVARTETYTISQGTPTFSYTLTPTIPGITLDTSTAGTTLLKIADTATVGTFMETLTVTDSVTGTVVIPISIMISPPPTLSNSGEVVTSGQVFSIDTGNSASYTPGSVASGTSAIRDISGGKKTVSINGTLSYSDDFSGSISLSSANSNYLSYTKDSQLTTWTIEAFVRIDAALAGTSCIVTNQFVNADMNFVLCLDIGRTLFTGFHKGAWTYKRTSTVLNLGEWYHITGTYDNVNGVKLYLNGTEAPIASVDGSGTAGGSAPPKGDTDLVYIGRLWSSDVFVPMTIGVLRIYNRALSLSEINQNMNATKARFQVAKINKLKSTKKYGVLNTDSFTVTAGGDTKTVSFQVGNRAGISWDTSTAGIVGLSVLSSLPVGTYYDTVTVTDNFNASAFVPIKFNVTKADTITVVVSDSPTVVTYSGTSRATNFSYSVSGLVNSETGTVTSKILGISDAQYSTTCANGGLCKVGDLAPGGGYVFYVSDKFIETGTSVSSGGIYLATAPVNWKSGTTGDPLSTWGCFPLDIQGTAGTVGAGASNTALIVAAYSAANCSSYPIAAKIASDLSITSNGTTYADWFLPSESEVAYMYNNVKTLAGLTSSYYWTSQQATNNGTNNPYWAKYFQFGSGSMGCTIGTACEWHRQNVTESYVSIRPIRAFSPTTVSTEMEPTQAGVYFTDYSFALTSPATLNNYQNVQVTQTALKINQAKQTALTVGQYDAYPDKSTYPINVYGGSGTGSIIRTGPLGSPETNTANCLPITGLFLTASSVGKCTIRVVKESDRNYLTETTTATIYWIQWKDSYATQVLSGSHAIPINGGTQIITHTETVTAGAFSDTATPIANAITSAKVGDVIRINSTGFSGLTSSQLSVTFRPMEDAVIRDVTPSYVEVVVPTGAVTGVIAIDSPRGVAYTQSLTISP